MCDHNQPCSAENPPTRVAGFQKEHHQNLHNQHYLHYNVLLSPFTMAFRTLGIGQIEVASITSVQVFSMSCSFISDIFL